MIGVAGSLFAKPIPRPTPEIDPSSLMSAAAVLAAALLLRRGRS
jgi:hypothetical protein